MNRKLFDDAFEIARELGDHAIDKYATPDAKRDPLAVMFAFALCCRRFLQGRAVMVKNGDAKLEEFVAELQMCLQIVMQKNLPREIVPQTPAEDYSDLLNMDPTATRH